MLALSGATGLVGRYLCNELIVNNIPFKRLGRDVGNIFPSDRSSFFFCDLFRPLENSLYTFLEDVDIVIHLAALLPGSSFQLADYFYCNSVASKALFDLCSDVGVSRFIYLSGANIMEPLDGVVTASSPYASKLRHPSYLASKMAGELLLLNTNSSTDLLIVRPSSVYGYNMRSGLFRNLYDSFSLSRPVRLSGNGLWSADYIYAGDICSCILQAIEKSATGALTLGSGTASTIHQIAKSFASLLGVEDDLILLEDYDDNSIPLGCLPIVSSEHVVSLLGRNPLSVSEGLKHAISSYGSF
jgi:nucleoside-diphosphate-sugar epimerase